MDLLVTYDIDTSTRNGQRRLARVARICEGYGLRVQYSVFECRLTESRLMALRIDLEDEIDPTTDQIRIYRFAGDITDARHTLGMQNQGGFDDLWEW